MDQSNDDLRRRIEELTRQTRWHRRSLVMLVTVGLGLTLMGQAKRSEAPEEVRARRFVLTDAAGARVGSWGVEADGRAVLQMGDPRGPQRLSLGVGPGGPRVVLTAPDGKRAASLAADQESPRLALSDKQGVERLWVALRADSPAIQFFDGAHVARSGLTTFNDDRGVAVVSESDATSHGLVLYAKNRDVVWSAP